MKSYFIYITTNPRKTVLYVGMTNNLTLRIQQHEQNKGKNATFAGRYFCYKLVYYEVLADVKQTIIREKEIKKMTRAQKEMLIRTMNPAFDFINIF